MAISRSTYSRRTASLLGAMLLALVAAGCGGSDDEAATSDRKSTHAEAVKLLRAATAPGNRAARSGRVDGRVELTLKGVPGFSEPFGPASAGRTSTGRARRSPTTSWRWACATTAWA